MATATDIANRSLSRIRVKVAGSDVSTAELSDFINAMNDYMASLGGLGVRLGYTTVSAGTDEVTIPDSCVRGLVANMAIEVAPDYGAEISPGLSRAATEGFATMQRVAREPVRASFPDTLPMGSGNSNVYTQEFYEDGGRFYFKVIGGTTTVAATSTAYAVGGDFNATAVEGFRVDITGLAKFSKDYAESLTFKSVLSCTGNGDYTFNLYQNGTSIQSASATLSGTATDVTLTKTVTVNPGDEFQLFVTQTSGAATDVVATGYFQCQ